MADEAGVLAWGLSVRRRLSQQKETEAKAGDVGPTQQVLLRSSRCYHRTASSWLEAGVMEAGWPGSGAEPDGDVGERVEVLLHVARRQRRARVWLLRAVDLPEPEDLRHPQRRHVQLSLVSRQELHAHKLYPSAVVLARLLDKGVIECAGRLVLELGAGPALPTIAALLNGAARAVASDYPDVAMLDNTRRNLTANLDADDSARAVTVPHAWGEPPLWSDVAGEGGFGLILLSDLLYELEHVKLLTSCAQALSASPRAEIIVAFQPHDSVNLQRQLDFFAVAEAPPFRFRVGVVACVRAPAMFDGQVPGRHTRRVLVFRLLRTELHMTRQAGAEDCRAARDTSAAKT